MANPERTPLETWMFQHRVTSKELARRIAKRTGQEPRAHSTIQAWCRGGIPREREVLKALIEETGIPLERLMGL